MNPHTFSTWCSGLPKLTDSFKHSIWSWMYSFWSAASSAFALFLTISLSHHFPFAMLTVRLLSSRSLYGSFSSALSSGVSWRCPFTFFVMIFFFIWMLAVDLEVDGVEVIEDMDGVTLAICVALTDLLLLGVGQQGVCQISSAWSRSVVTWQKGLSELQRTWISLHQQKQDHQNWYRLDSVAMVIIIQKYAWVKKQQHPTWLSMFVSVTDSVSEWMIVSEWLWICKCLDIGFSLQQYFNLIFTHLLK